MRLPLEELSVHFHSDLAGLSPSSEFGHRLVFKLPDILDGWMPSYAGQALIVGSPSAPQSR